MLPNDPRIKALEPIQWVWLLSNMENDNKEFNKALGGKDALSIDSNDGVDLSDASALTALARSK